MFFSGVEVDLERESRITTGLSYAFALTIGFFFLCVIIAKISNVFTAVEENGKIVFWDSRLDIVHEVFNRQIFFNEILDKVKWVDCRFEESKHAVVTKIWTFFGGVFFGFLWPRKMKEWLFFGDASTEQKGLDNKVEALEGDIQVLQGNIQALEGKIQALVHNNQRDIQKIMCAIQNLDNKTTRCPSSANNGELRELVTPSYLLVKHGSLKKE
jgi:hypothetical protein